MIDLMSMPASMPHRAASSGQYDALQSRAIDQLHEPPANVDTAAVAKAREQPAHRLEREAEMAADLLARHAQHELAPRVAALVVAPREIDQERREALFGAHRSEHHHHAALERDRLAVVRAAADAVGPDHVTRHMVSRHLLVAVVGDDLRLERAEADRVERARAVAGAKQRSALADVNARRADSIG